MDAHIKAMNTWKIAPDCYSPVDPKTSFLSNKSVANVHFAYNK
jgi:hypothetical protein